MQTGVVLPLLESPSAIPGYRLEELTDRRPGLWSTYRATELASRQPVEVTIVSASLQHDGSYSERFERDVQRAGALRHPALVGVLEGGRGQRGLHLVTAAPGDQELLDAVHADATSPERILGLLAPVAQALDAVHEHGLIHGAVMPRTIRIAAAERAQLVGLGLADETTAARDEDPESRSYLAPEAVAGHPLTPAADVYGLAATLHRCLAGEDEPRVDGASRGMPAALRPVVRRGLSTDPARRPHSAGALIDELLQALFGEPRRPGSSQHSVSSSAPVEPPGGRRVERPAVNGRPREKRLEPPTASKRPRVSAAAALPAGAGAGVPRSRPASVSAARRGAALLAASTVAAAAVGTLLATREDEEPSAASRVAQPRVASTDHLAVTVAPGWSTARGDEPEWARGLAEPIRLTAPGGDRQAGLAAGLTKKVDERLLPPALAATLETPPRPQPVRLGRYAALRYEDVASADTDARLVLYAVPTSGGAATLGCTASAASPRADAVLRECESIAASLVIEDYQPQPVGPDATYLAALNANVERLAGERAARRRALKGTRTAAGQGRIAAALARSHAAAADAQAAVPVSLVTARANQAVVRDLQAIAGAYGSAASAARAGDSTGFDQARGAVARGELQLEDHLKDLEDLATTR